MKKLGYVCMALVMMTGFTACEIDNFDEPDAGIQGTVIDETTGQPMETAVKKESMSIRLVEISYAKDENTVVTPQDLNMKQDGTYSHNKLFAGTYTVIPFQGPYYPIEEPTTVELKSGQTTQVDFRVTPYISLEWVQEPVQDPATGYIMCSFKYKRNYKDGSTSPVPSKMRMFVAHTQYCGPDADDNFSPAEQNVGTEDVAIVMSSKAPMKFTGTYWVRIGVNSDDQTGKKFNYTSIKKIDVKAYTE